MPEIKIEPKNEKSRFPFLNLKSRISKRIVEKRNIERGNLRSARSINDRREDEFKSELFKIRRKSCHCSKCGPLNKFQQKNIFVAGDIKNNRKL